MLMLRTSTFSGRKAELMVFLVCKAPPMLLRISAEKAARDGEDSALVGTKGEDVALRVRRGRRLMT